jgi:DNA-binding beta-propeller fold protein YncE
LLVVAAFILLMELGCGDQYRPVANPIVGPGGQPQNNHNAYVVNFNPAGNGSTMQLNVSGDTVTQLQTTGSGSNYESFLSTSTGAVFVSNGNGDSVSEFNVNVTGVVTTINLPAGSHPVAVATTQPGVVYVLNSQPNSACSTTGSISNINTATLNVINTVCLGPAPIAMVQAAGGGRVFIIDQSDNSIWVYDPTSQSVLSVLSMANGIGLNPVFLAASSDGAFIFVVNKGDGINPGTLNIISTASFSFIPSVPLGIKPTFAFYDLNLVRLYVTNSGSNTVSIFDASNINFANSPAIPLLGTTTVGTAPVSVTALPNGTKFYVANSGSSSVTDVSATSFAVLQTIPLPAGSTPAWIASEPSSTKIYVANQAATTIIQTSNDTVVTSIAAPAQDPTCTGSCALQQPLMIITD